MNDEEFLYLLEKYRHDFYRFTYRSLWNSGDCDDVFASAVAVAYENLYKFTQGTNFRAWMYKILTNKCFVANREAKRSNVDIDSIDHLFNKEDRSYESILENPEQFVEKCGDEVVKALDCLSAMERSCLLLLTFEKYSYKEIAHILEIPVGTVMTHLSRGRAKLRKSLMKYAQEEGILSQKTSEEKSLRRASS